MTLHSMELPSINSTTSISDNAELRNYYDNPLFKNSSGRSLADLPRKAQEILDNKNNISNANNVIPKVDFIKGFSNQQKNNNANNNNNLDKDITDAFAQFRISTNNKQNSLFQDFTQQSQQSQSQSQQSIVPPRRQSIFNINTNDNNIPTNYPVTNSNNIPSNSLAFNFSSNNSIPHFMNDFNVERRSSYISDNLIHNQQQGQGQGQNHGQFPHLEPLTYQQQQPSTNNYNNNNNIQQQQQQQYYYNNNINNNATSKYGYLNYVNGQISQQRQTNYTNSNNKPNLQINNKQDSNNNNNNSGLILTKEKQLASSDELAKLYQDCGKYYFSSKQVYEFTDYLKKMLDPEINIEDIHNLKDIHQPLIKFLNFLKSCNLNYNPQSDGFISQERKTTTTNNNFLRRNSVPLQTMNKSTSAYLHYRPLVLVSLKNGKLELLSMPAGANMAMKRGDLVIIDGDRGKDLTLVVEPIVSLDLALIINFLKKKIHFDSLITSKRQHYPNENFIQALENCTNGISDSLDPKLYDIIELTQLIVPSKQVLRYATSWESSTNLHNKFQDELKALHIAQLKLRTLNSGGSNDSVQLNGNDSGLNIKILNAEFQFDRKKLTFYYICEERNDFRELIKELFKFYKTRIWLCAIPNDLDIDTKYYDKEQKEVKMYQDMMQHFTQDELMENNTSGFVVAPPLNELILDNFQIAVYKELVQQLF
ncbi:hypothetical protein C6P45_000634 [Maudiozyma exigua]|uniref:PSP1 C-terminal domain-containing protein n=1 Tax=Maudiozyma exigua TaxID=34358 RepID=A0A9P7B7G9_MAUEX|nr:hypothetical protein C6P45_000634 [Kazachstania exigua]